MTAAQLVFLIGAARSGTKFLRDTLAASEAIAAVPYDINYVWRHGNERLDHDALPVEAAGPKQAARVRRQIERFAPVERSTRMIVEKTVSNTLRVPYIHALFPNARFIYLEREPKAVIESSFRQWTKPPDKSYLFQKFRYFPLSEWRYALWFLKSQLHRGDEPVWGPRYPKMALDVEEHGVEYAVAQQWLQCVTCAREGLPLDRTFLLSYSDLAQGGPGFASLLNWLTVGDDRSVTAYRENNLRDPASTWPGSISDSGQRSIEHLIASSEVSTFDAWRSAP